MRDIPDFLRREFAARGNVDVLDISVKAYPDETNFIVLVDALDIAAAVEIGNDLDGEISTVTHKAFVIVRKAPPELVHERALPMSEGVHDNRAVELTRLISARSRVSEAQPALSYVREAHLNLPAIGTPRHHLVFGRRGAGKTALLVEARRLLHANETLSCWINVQTLRNESPGRVFLHIFEEVSQTIATRQQQLRPESVVSVMTIELYDKLRRLLSAASSDDLSAAQAEIPGIQRTLKRFLTTSGLRLFIFIDDFYYLPRQHQPLLLDMIHGCVRDCDAWLKIASIRHLTRWFQSSPPLGLQTGHDADIVDLDVTLQDPSRAKNFLEDILHHYARRVGVNTLNRLFHQAALDRLVLASGAVPRDYLILASNSIAKARQRQKARLVGVQDVNQAAGDAAHVKVQELEEDMASNVASAARTLAALKKVRDFCLEETSHTYFLVGYREKEDRPHLYSVLTDLLDLRLIHLIDGGVSDPHSAGQRSEAFMLDLSQFSGSRLKQGLRVLDFVGGRIVSRGTRGASDTGPDKIGDTPRKLIAILRTAPKLALDVFSDVTDPAS